NCTIPTIRFANLASCVWVTTTSCLNPFARSGTYVLKVNAEHTEVVFLHASEPSKYAQRPGKWPGKPDYSVPELEEELDHPLESITENQVSLGSDAKSIKVIRGLYGVLKRESQVAEQPIVLIHLGNNERDGET